MRIPTEHFANIPVNTLSPNVSPREEEAKEFPASVLKPPTLKSAENSSSGNSSCGVGVARQNSVGSAPSSPNLSLSRRSNDSDSSTQRSVSPGLESEERDQFDHSSSSGPYSLPTVSSISLGIRAFKRYCSLINEVRTMYNVWWLEC